MRDIMPVPARLLGVLALVLLTVAALGLRLAAAPSGAGFRLAMAAAPGGGLYVADAGRGLLRIDQSGGLSRVGPLPTGAPLALAAADELVLGAEDGLFASRDGGRSWIRLPVAGRHFLAVAASGATVAGAAWGGGLYVLDLAEDQLPLRPIDRTADGLEVTSIAFGSGGAVLAASLAGVLTSLDSGRSWQLAPDVPDRVTAVAWEGPTGLAATWSGGLYELANRAWRRTGTLPPGVWAYEPSGPTAATASGLYVAGHPALAGREAVALADSGGVLYAGLAGGLVEASSDGRSWRRVFQA